MEILSNFDEIRDYHIIMIFLRNLIVGIASVGLFIGAIGFSFYLYRLSRMPKESR